MKDALTYLYCTTPSTIIVFTSVGGVLMPARSVSEMLPTKYAVRRYQGNSDHHFKDSTVVGKIHSRPKMEILAKTRRKQTNSRKRSTVKLVKLLQDRNKILKGRTLHRTPTATAMDEICDKLMANSTAGGLCTQG